MMACFKLLILFFLLNGMAYASSQDEINEDSRQALRFFAAKDYQRAVDYYERLAKQDLPDWQRAIVLYNLGTLALVQNEWPRALGFFQSISPSQLSSPALFKYIEFNQGLTYLRQANALQKGPQAENLEEKLYFVQRSLEHLSAAEKIDCLVQKIEDSSQSCLISSELKALLKIASFFLNQLRQEQRTLLLEQANRSQLLFLLIDNLKKLQSPLSLFKQLAIPSSFKSSYSSYLLSLGESSVPLWNRLKEKGLSQSQQELVNAAQDKFQQSLLAIRQENLSLSIRFISEAIEELKNSQGLEPDSTESLLDQILLQTRLLLIEDRLQKTSLEQFKRQVEKLPTSSLKDQALEALTTAIDQFDPIKQTAARFFLFHTAHILQRLHQENNASSSPQTIIASAIEQAKRALLLTRLFQLITVKDDSLLKKMERVLQEAQTRQLELVEPFIATVKQAETERFRQIGAISSPRCQNKPWEQAIPLFESGYEHAKTAEAQLLHRPMQTDAALSRQEKTILDWQQLLQLLNQKQAEGESSSSENENENENQADQPLQSSTQIHDVLQLLEDMQEDDKPQETPQPSKELNAW